MIIYIFYSVCHHARNNSQANGHFTGHLFVFPWFSILHITHWKVDVTPIFFSHSHFPSSMLRHDAKILHTALSETACLQEQKVYKVSLKGGPSCSLYRGNYVKTVDFFFFFWIIFQVFQQLSRAIMALEKTEWERKGEKVKGPRVIFRHKTESVWQLRYVPHEELASISYSAVWQWVPHCFSPNLVFPPPSGTSLWNLLKCSRFSPPLLINVSNIASVCLSVSLCSTQPAWTSAWTSKL